MDDTQLNIIKENPIGEGLETFHALFDSIYNNTDISYDDIRDILEQLIYKGKKESILLL